MMLLKNSFKRFLRTVMALVLSFAMLTPYSLAAESTEKEETSSQKETTAEATTSSAADDRALKNLQNKYDKLEKQIEQNEKKLDAVENSKSEEEAKRKKLNSEIADLNSQISLLNEKISVLDGSIDKITGNINKLDDNIEELDKEINQINYDIVVTNNDINSRYETLKKRLRASYMAGNLSDLQILLSSSDFSDYMNNEEMIKRVAAYDMEVINGLEEKLDELDALNKRCSDAKTEIEDKKSELEGEKKTLSARKADEKSSEELLDTKLSEVSEKRAESNKLIDQMDKESKEYKDIIAAKEAERQRVEAEMDKLILARGSNAGDKIEEDSSNGDEVKSSGKYVKDPLKNMQWPVPYKGCYVSSPYGYRTMNGVKKLHKGMDITVSKALGKDIVAAQNGKIFETGYNNSCGNYVVIDHGSGVFTRYYHCQKVLVKKDQFVDKGTRIALIGNTGDSRGPHLHFMVCVKENGQLKPLNPANYISNPYK